MSAAAPAVPWQDRVFVIAEAGVNHNGDVALALQLVDAAADAGADAVKFQTFDAAALVAKSAVMADYQKANTGVEESQYAMLKRLELSRDAQDAVRVRAAERGILFFSTAFDPGSVDYLMSLDIPLWKIPSGEITNYPYLCQIAAQARPTIVSTGMATVAEIDDAVRVLLENGLKREQIAILHCNTDYPTQAADVNLRAMPNLGALFGTAFGYSDHTLGETIAVAAVALGARVIEKHFTLDRSLPGPDHKASLEPDELASMVSAIRAVEVALGDGIKRPSVSEARNRPVARKSIVAARAIRAGDVFSADNLAIKRPGTGISPMRWTEVVGRVAPRDFAEDEVISW
ncbi:N-acetylneuraminate synthase [Chitinilyticum piscinae]|uniref:N-acetylneuraminate synthase n=1 Tax=Chitinilyticum piscinae TaxID=2866724 RepID=A0A8J7FNE3_9NEIS|nr:N-acetylneuraminate synthase [Chitinilyticum piscinae]MBE9610650.1 N-acetylneuraminate synthase [Chitinilyticum piscinae]